MGVMTTHEADDYGTCPTCGGPKALVPLGDRIDHPHRWLPWTRSTVHIALCVRSGATIEAAETGLLTS